MTATDFKIYEGDALTKLKELDTDSVNMSMTSPPYYKKRAPATQLAAELGNEPTQWEYIDHLIEIFKEVKRVVKDSIWVNIGDGANSAKTGNTNGQREHKSSVSVSPKLRQAQSSLRKLAQKDHPVGSLSCLPELFVTRMVYELQLSLRAKIVWHKPNAFVEGNAANRRFNSSYEMLYWFVKHPGPSYYFEPQWELCATPMASIDHIRKGKGIKHRAPFGGKKHAGRHDLSAIYSGKAWNPDRHLDQTTGEPLRRMRDVWSIRTKGYKHNREHYSTYPLALCQIPILACCPPEGVVLDPFCGTGTTGVAALLLGRRFIGIELSDKYLPIATTRLQNNELERKDLRKHIPRPKKLY